MSCFLVGSDHIQYLVQAAKKYEACCKIAGEFVSMRNASDDQCQRLCTMLHEANAESYAYRYADNESVQRDVRGARENPVAWEDNPFRHVEATQTLKALRCYEYQSCERPDWRESDAFLNYVQIMHAAIAHLPGYDKAAWGVPEAPTMRSRRMI